MRRCIETWECCAATQKVEPFSASAGLQGVSLENKRETPHFHRSFFFPPDLVGTQPNSWFSNHSLSGPVVELFVLAEANKWWNKQTNDNLSFFCLITVNEAWTEFVELRYKSGKYHNWRCAVILNIITSVMQPYGWVPSSVPSHVIFLISSPCFICHFTPIFVQLRELFLRRCGMLYIPPFLI